jgi:lysophospholipase L1-like esterase
MLVTLAVLLLVVAIAVPRLLRVAATGTDRFLALGDSYTIGEGVSPESRWPVQLARTVNARGVQLAEPEVIARTGWTAAELAAGLAAARPEGPYAFVSLQVGVNDQYRGLDREAYRNRLRALIAQAVSLAGGRPNRVLVISIPDWGVTPFADGRDRGAIAREIDAFNGVALEESERSGARWIDVTRISREERTGWLAGDGLHPSGEQYAEWVELIRRAMSEETAMRDER